MTDSDAAADEADDRGAPLGLGRVLFGLGMALQASEDFRDMEDTVEYAESAGVPMPELAAPFASGMMLASGLGVALWRVPRLTTGAVAAFLAVVTPTMHDFWNVEDPQQRQSEMTDFLKNVALFGTALALLALAGEPWPYALSL